MHKIFFSRQITRGISTLESVLNICLPKRNKSNDLHSKLLNDMYNKMWSLDAKSTQIPRFVAADLSQILSERENSESLVSIEQLLATVHNLRYTVDDLQDNMVTQGAFEKYIASASNGLSTATASASFPLGTALTSAASLVPSAPPNPLTPTAPAQGAFSSEITLIDHCYAEVMQRQ